MERTWNRAAHEHNGTAAQKQRLNDLFARMDWQQVGTSGLALPMMAGTGIAMFIRQAKLPGATHIAISHDMAPYGLYGIRCNFRNGRADFYLCDEGSAVVALASDFYPVVAEEAAHAG